MNLKLMILNLVTTNAGWLARQAIKYSAVLAASVAAYLMGKGLDATHAGVIAAGVTSAVLGITEQTLSWIARKYAVPEIGAVNEAIEAAKKAVPAVVGCLCLLTLTSCAPLTAFFGTSAGAAVIALVEVEAKNLEHTWEAGKIPGVIEKARAAVAKLPAKTGNPIKDLPRDMQEQAWNKFISLAQDRYKALTGGKYVTPVTL